jgi:hypothetical protein
MWHVRGGVERLDKVLSWQDTTKALSIEAAEKVIAYLNLTIDEQGESGGKVWSMTELKKGMAEVIEETVNSWIEEGV